MQLPFVSHQLLLALEKQPVVENDRRLRRQCLYDLLHVRIERDHRTVPGILGIEELQHSDHLVIVVRQRDRQAGDRAVAIPFVKAFGPRKVELRAVPDVRNID